MFGTTTDVLLGRKQPAPADEPEPQQDVRAGWDDHRANGVAFAALALLVGGLMLCAGLMGGDASFWELLWPSVLLVLGVRGLLDRFSFFSIGCALFGGFFLLNNMEVLPFEIGSELIFPIILLIVGIAILADALTRPARPHRHHHSEVSKNEFRIDGETFTYAVSFGDQAQFVTMPRLSYGLVSASFGQCRLDLSETENVSENCVIEARCSFGELTLLVPQRFFIRCDSSTAFASVDVSGHPAPEPVGTITLKANASFGQINVQYI